MINVFLKISFLFTSLTTLFNNYFYKTTNLWSALIVQSQIYMIAGNMGLYQ